MLKVLSVVFSLCTLGSVFGADNFHKTAPLEMIKKRHLRQASQISGAAGFMIGLAWSAKSVLAPFLVSNPAIMGTTLVLSGTGFGLGVGIGLGWKASAAYYQDKEPGSKIAQHTGAALAFGVLLSFVASYVYNSYGNSHKK